MTDQVTLADTMRAHIREYQTQLVNSEKHGERCLGAIQAIENLFKALQEQKGPEDVDQLSGSSGEAETGEEVTTPAPAE